MGLSDLKTENLKMGIGQRVRDFRIENHYTQAQFAEMIDVSINFLSEIENGKKGMSQETLCKLCNYFNLSADYLLLGKTPSPNSSKNLIEIASTLEADELNVVIEYLTSLKKIKDLNL